VRDTDRGAHGCVDNLSFTSSDTHPRQTGGACQMLMCRSALRWNPGSAAPSTPIYIYAPTHIIIYASTHLYTSCMHLYIYAPIA